MTRNGCIKCTTFAPKEQSIFLRNTLSIFLAALILFQSFSKVWIILSFKVNQNYIARVLCINRDKPEMRCKGKCVLMQRIKASEEKEKKEIPQSIKALKDILYCFDASKWLLQRPVGVKGNEHKLTYYQNPSTTAFVNGVFRPPKIETVRV